MPSANAGICAQDRGEVWREGNTVSGLLGANATVTNQPAPEARKKVARASGFARCHWIKSDKTQSRPERAPQASSNTALIENQSTDSFDKPHTRCAQFFTPFSGRVLALRS